MDLDDADAPVLRGSRNVRAGHGGGSDGGAGRLARSVTLALFVGSALLGIGLALTPLFNLLGYESSLVLAVFASLCGVRQGANVVRNARLRLRSDPEAGERETLLRKRPLAAMGGLFLRALVGTLALLVLPLLILLLNGLRVRNCNYLAGLGFFVMMPVLSSACAATVGVVSALLVAPRRSSLRSLRGLALGYAVLLGSALVGFWRFLASPAIFSYNAFIGYFPGALYDEDVTIRAPFFGSRLEDLLAVATALALAAAFLGVKVEGHRVTEPLRLRLSRPPRSDHAGLPPPRRSALLLGGLGLALLAVLHGFGGRLGYYTDLPSIEGHLSGVKRTPHFVLRYRPGSAVAKSLALYEREHELRYAQLRDRLGIEPSWRAPWLARVLGLARRDSLENPRIVSYLFDTAEEKRRWMGAAHTFIAKPWRREIYLQHLSWPHPVLRHELAHVFAGAAGDPLLRLPFSGLLPNQGLVEGFAEAADPRGGATTLHQSVRAMRQTGFEPPLAAVFSSGFLRLPPRRAYTMAGSFCLYLLERYGAASLVALHREGGQPASFARIYHKPLSELQAEWSRFIDGQSVSERVQQTEREVFRRPAVFQKVCAHDIALRKHAAEVEAAAGDLDKALALFDGICKDDPGEPQHQSERLELLFSARRYDQTRDAAQALLGHPLLTPVLRGRIESRLGDLAVLRGAPDEARRAYESAVALPSDEASARTNTVKLFALDLTQTGTTASAEAGSLILRYLIRPKLGELAGDTDGGDALAVYGLTQAIAARPELGLSHYLLGLLLYNRAVYAEAAEQLAAALARPLPDRRFERQALLLLGQCELLRGRSEAATAAFTRLRDLVLPDEPGQLVVALDWLDRARRWPTL